MRRCRAAKPLGGDPQCVVGDVTWPHHGSLNLRAAQKLPREATNVTSNVHPSGGRIAGHRAQHAGAGATATAAHRRETTKIDGTDGLYLFRNGNHQAIFIVTKDGVIATDPVAYGKPQGGQQYVDEIKKITDKPIKYLIYSHHHYDHIAGGKAFKDAGAKIVAHKNATARLKQLKDPNTVCPMSRHRIAAAPSSSAAPRWS